MQSLPLLSSLIFLLLLLLLSVASLQLLTIQRNLPQVTTAGYSWCTIDPSLEAFQGKSECICASACVFMRSATIWNHPYHLPSQTFSPVKLHHATRGTMNSLWPAPLIHLWVSQHTSSSSCIHQHLSCRKTLSRERGTMFPHMKENPRRASAAEIDLTWRAAEQQHLSATITAPRLPLLKGSFVVEITMRTWVFVTFLPLTFQREQGGPLTLRIPWVELR